MRWRDVRHPDNYWDNDDPEDDMRESVSRDLIHLPRIFVAVLCIGLLTAGSGVAWHYSGTESSKAPQESSAAADVQQKLQEQDAKIKQLSDQTAAATDVQQKQDATIKQLSDQIAQLNATVNAFQASAREVQPAQKAAKKH
jgi:septal ring factor EnvC (AmiA/AmiB activator)